MVHQWMILLWTFILFSRYHLPEESISSFQLEEVETHTFLRHVPSRWLTLGPVVDRLIEQWEPLQKYFTDLANKDPENTPTSSAFKRSCIRLQNKQTLVELHFLQSVMPLYHSFQLFQIEAPLVHLLYEELCWLVYMMMGRYVKASVYQNKTGQDLKEVKHGELQNQLSDKEQGWSGGAKVSCILCHLGVQLILAYSWARPAILVAGKGREVIYFFCFFTFIPVPLSSQSLSFISSAISSVSFLPFFGRRHKMTHKGWRVVKPQHNKKKSQTKRW